MSTGAVSNDIERRRLEKIVRHMRHLANCSAWINYGTAAPSELAPFCRDFIHHGVGVRLIFTRDAGMHSGGWLRNPDYERCWHLSISFRSPDGAESLPQHQATAKKIARLFYGDNVRLLWVERPFSQEGKRLDVWHYRLFADAHWQPIKPSGEVYSSDNTELGWKSFSEIHGRKPDMAMEA